MASYSHGGPMWKAKGFVPSWSFLNHSSCVLVGAAYLALMGWIVWTMLDLDIPLIAMGSHR